MTNEDKLTAHVRDILGVPAKKDSQVGEIPSGSMANQNGLDEIDKWAMQEGNAQRTIGIMTPNRKHIYI